MAGVLSITLLTVSIIMAIFLTAQRHWRAYQQGECTREKMVRNIFFDLLGLALTMGTAIYAGRLAGGYFGLRSGLWVGLLAGFVGGFAAAWVVRTLWGRVSRAIV